MNRIKVFSSFLSDNTVVFSEEKRVKIVYEMNATGIKLISESDIPPETKLDSYLFTEPVRESKKK